MLELFNGYWQDREYLGLLHDWLLDQGREQDAERVGWLLTGKARIWWDERQDKGSAVGWDVVIAAEVFQEATGGWPIHAVERRIEEARDNVEADYWRRHVPFDGGRRVSGLDPLSCLHGLFGLDLESARAA
jgi:hypothetical protein